MDWTELWGIVTRLGGAFALALPIGWEREKHARSLGLRTFPLVAMASTAYLVVAEEVFSEYPEAQGRVLEGLVTGIGFIGAGAILKVRGEETVHGTATAAGVWATGALGAAVAYGRWEIAVMVSLLTFGTFRWMTPLKETIEARGDGPGDRPRDPRSVPADRSPTD